MTTKRYRAVGTPRLLEWEFDASEGQDLDKAARDAFSLDACKEGVGFEQIHVEAVEPDEKRLEPWSIAPDGRDFVTPRIWSAYQPDDLGDADVEEIHEVRFERDDGKEPEGYWIHLRGIDLNLLLMDESGHWRLRPDGEKELYIGLDGETDRRRAMELTAQVLVEAKSIGGIERIGRCLPDAAD